MVRMRSQEEALQGKTYQKLSLTQHLPNYKKLQPSGTDQMRTMAAFMYFALYKLLTGKAKSQEGWSHKFGCKTTLFKHLVTGKKQPGRPGMKDCKMDQIEGSTAYKKQMLITMGTTSHTSRKVFEKTHKLDSI